MPYIDKKRRETLLEDIIKTPGELNYILTQVIQSYLANKDKVGYAEFNDVMGALEGCKLEFYARVVRPYEDKKIEENGDVYE